MISDTHSHLDPKVFEYFKDCDEIWHAGDIGNMEVAEKLAAFKPFRAVYGNIDGQKARLHYPEDLHLNIEGLKIWMTHIGGYPGHYSPRVRALLNVEAPDIFICGHSHILRVMRDPKYHNMITINPGAAGIEGFHKVKTILRFALDKGKVLNMEAIELGKRGAIG